MAVFRKLFMILALAALLSGCIGPEPVNEVALELTVSAIQTENAGGVQTQPTLAPSPTAAATPTRGECLAEVTQNNINMRISPDGGIIGCCLADGERVKVFEISADEKWARIEGIEKPGHNGWVDTRFLLMSGACQ
jgi:hypothetical protein